MTKLNYTDNDYRNALIEVMRTYKNGAEIRDHLINNIGKKKREWVKQENEKAKYKESKLSPYQKLQRDYKNLQWDYKQLKEQNNFMYDTEVPF